MLIRGGSPAPGRARPPRTLRRRDGTGSDAIRGPAGPQLALGTIAVIGAANAFVWLAVAVLPGPGASGAVFTLVVLLACSAVYWASRGRSGQSLALVAYLAMVEPAVRRYLPEAPFFSVAYVALAVAGAVLLRHGVGRLTLPAAAMGVYVLLEAAGLMEALNADHARAVLVPSLVTFTLLLSWSGRALTRVSVREILASVLLGALSLVCLLAKALLSGDPIAWASESNFEASGGMGPNQVSLVLAIGGLASAYFARESRGSRLAVGLFWSTLAVISLLMVLTFSRGGAIILVLSAALYWTLSARRPHDVVRPLAALALLTLVVSSTAERRTEGAAGRRYLDQSPGNRLLLLQIGLQMLEERPVFGVGTGNYYSAVADVDRFGLISGAHNELTRAAAEHGMPGLLIWLLWAVAIVVTCLRAPPPERGLAAALGVAGLLSMVYNGSKLVIQPVLLCVALGIALDSRLVSPRSRARRSGWDGRHA